MRFAGLVAFFGLIGPAVAAPDELVLSLEPELGLLSADEQPSRVGVGGAVSAWLGLTDALWLSAGIGGSRHAGTEGLPSLTLAEGFLGLVAALDVFRAIPFLEGGLGLVVGPEFAPSARLGAGLDYLLTPNLGLGAVLRYRPLTDDLGANSRLSASIRLSWRFEL